jgi:hypothetical protein
MSSFYVTFFGQAEYVLCMRVCFTSTVVTTGHGIILMLAVNMGIKYTSSSILGLESSEALVWALLLPNRRTVQQYDFLIWGRCLAVVECDISRKVDWMSRAYCMASLVTVSNSDGFFSVGTPVGASLCCPS